MKRAVPFAAMILAFGLPFNAAQAAKTVEAGPIWDQQDAEKKCPTVCEKHGTWTGHWWTTVQGKMSVCQCEAPVTQAAVTGIHLSASSSANPPAGPKGYKRIGYWDVDAGGGHGTNNATFGHWMMALYSQSQKNLTPKSSCVNDVQLRASSSSKAPSGPKGYKLIGYWDVDGGGSHGTDGSTGHWMMAMYANTAPIGSGTVCVTDVYLTASNTGTPRPGPKGYTRIGDWDVDGGGSVGTDGSKGHWRMALYINKTKLSPPKQKPQSEFSCQDKRTCGTMKSCQEAYYHLNECGNKRLDSDKDGVPCESICK
jgi:hypothetical protein